MNTFDVMARRKEFIKTVFRDIVIDNPVIPSCYHPDEPNAIYYARLFDPSTFAKIDMCRIWKTAHYIFLTGVRFPRSTGFKIVYDYAYEINSGYIYEAKDGGPGFDDDNIVKEIAKAEGTAFNQLPLEELFLLTDEDFYTKHNYSKEG